MPPKKEEKKTGEDGTLVGKVRTTQDVKGENEGLSREIADLRERDASDVMDEAAGRTWSHDPWVLNPELKRMKKEALEDVAERDRREKRRR